MKIYEAFLGVTAAIAVTASAWAQQPEVEEEVARTGYAPAIAYPSPSFSWLDHASTAAEGELRGAAAFVESAGKGNYFNSLAAMNYQEAYRRALENSVLQVEAYYGRKDLWHDYQEKYRRKPLDEEGYRKLAASRTPDRLTAEQYDPETGAIRWPFPLDGEPFAEPRQAVEKRLAERSVENAGWGSRNYELLNRDVEAMRALLKQAREALSPDRYVHADAFLDSVLWEGRFVPDAEQLTAVQ